MKNHKTAHNEFKQKRKRFADWFETFLSFGYGTGELPVLYMLKRFLELADPEDQDDYYMYDHKILEQEFGAAAAWLLIDKLCSIEFVDYGSSPRYGWVNFHENKHKEIVTMLRHYTAEELAKMISEEFCK